MLVGMLIICTPALAEAKAALPAEPANFTLEVALARAMRNNPNIQAAEARLKQAQLEKENQDLWWARTIRANANYTPFGGNYGGQAAVTPDGLVLPTAAIGVGVNLGEILAGPKNSARAEQTIIIAEADLKRTMLEVASNVTAAYQEYQTAKQLTSFSGDMVEAAETDVKIAERQFARGTTAVNSLLGARLAVQRVRADQFTTTGNVAKSWTNLLNLMGDPGWLPEAPATAQIRR
jgi:outer membrane protein TolC